MDPLSQAVAGATFTQAYSSNSASQKLAFLAGALSGMAADLDVFFRSDTDPLLFLEFHRQFTHSLIFIPLGGLVCALILFPFLKKKIGFGQIYVLTVLGYASHGLLDACTSYGTQLFWPFSDVRIAWDIISIIDPLFTLPVLVLVIAGFVSGKSRYARMGLVYGLMYLMIGLFQHGRAMDVLESVAEQRGHVASKATVRPTLANLYLWKLLYEHEGRFYVDAVRVGMNVEHIPGESIGSVIPDDMAIAGTIQARDIERFRWFSDGYIAQYPDKDSLIIGDIRYSLLPNQIEPLWGIRLDPAAPELHVDYVVSRKLTKESQMEFFSMLFAAGEADAVLIPSPRPSPGGRGG